MTISLRLLLFLCLLLTISLLPKFALADQNANGTTTFSGEIMDSICANNKSHDVMMKEMKSMGHEKATCTAKCIELGAKYVLFDSAQGTIYQLEKPDAVEKFAGHQVRITGTLEKKKIKIANIEATD